MIRVFVVYAQAPDPDRYRKHAALCEKVPGGSFRHGAVTRTFVGEPAAYYAEWEFPDDESFRAAIRTEEFAATGKDADELGVPYSVHVADVG
jgi:hypothetical protein